jgi:hypothetical protein
MTFTFVMGRWGKPGVSLNRYFWRLNLGLVAFAVYFFDIERLVVDAGKRFAATSAHGTEPTDSEPKASPTGEDGRSQESADGGKAVMEGDE